MPKRASKLNRVAILGITLVILVVPFCLYYFVYVSSQQSYFIDRSHRSLAGIGRQIVTRVDGLVSVVLSPARRVCANDPLEIEPEVLDNYFKPLSPFGTELQFDRESASVELDETKPFSPIPVISVKFKQDGSIILNYECGGGPQFKQGRFSIASNDTKRLLTPPIARFVFDDRQTAAEGLFDRVLVADSDTGEVVYEYGRDSLTVVNLNDLLAKRTANSPGGKSTEADQAATSNAKTREQASGGRAERGSSDLTRINIAETDYRLFVQPIQINVLKAGAEGEQSYRLTVCGLVRSESLNTKTFSFSYTLLLLFTLLVLMTIVSGPLIKLRLVGPKDRLRKADVVFTACSAFFGTALLTLTLLDFYTYMTVENKLDGQLKELASTVDRNLRTELGRASDQLDELNWSFRANLPGAGVEASCPSGDSIVTVEPRFYKDNILGHDGILDPENIPYPYFNNATWANLSGEQRIKFTTRTSHTAFVSVASRQFFTDAKAGKLLNVTVDQGSQRPMCLQALTSRTSGENVAVISKLTPDKEYVSFLDTRLLSLYDPVLPAGYGFCVIDSSGLVLFHTDDAKNLDEKFFEECNMDKSLRAAIQSRESDWINLQYLGGAQRAFVTPIQDLPWSLVVFRDRRILRTANLEAMTLVAITFVLYSLLLAGALALIFVVRSRTGFSMLWPDSKRHECYKQVAVANSLLFLIFGILVIVSSGTILIVWALLFPALSLVHFLQLTGEKHRVHLSKLRVPALLGDWRRSYSLAIVSLTALACVAPTMAFFKLVRDEQIKVFIRYGQISLAQGLERREDQVRSLYSALDPQVDAGTAREQLISLRLDSEFDVYSLFFFQTEWKKNQDITGRPRSGLMGELLSTLGLFYDETSVDSLPLVRGQSADGRWASTEDGDNVELVLRAITRQDDSLAAGALADENAESNSQQGGAKPAARWALTSVVPGFMSIANPLQWLFLVTLAGILAFAYVALRFAARRILLLDLKTPSLAGCFQMPLDGQIGENYLVVCPPVFDHRDRFPASVPPTFLRVDLSSINTEEAWRKEIEFVESIPDLPVVIDRFECNRDDTLWNDRKLLFAQRLVKKCRRVVIVSSVDPIDFPLSVGKKNNATSANVAQKKFRENPDESGKQNSASNESPVDRTLDGERWSLTLASFVRVNTFEQAEPDACPGLFNAVGAGNSPWRYLESLAPIVPSANADAEELIAEVGEQAENYYRAVWSTCSRDERMTLFRVAQDGLVSRLDPDLRRLMQRGFVVRDPSLRLMDESFRRFVLSVSAEEGVNRYRADVESHWDRLKAPLLLVLLGVIAFLFVTQKELFDSALTLVSALTGGVIALFKLVGVFQKGKDSGAAES